MYLITYLSSLLSVKCNYIFWKRILPVWSCTGLFFANLIFIRNFFFFVSPKCPETWFCISFNLVYDYSTLFLAFFWPSRVSRYVVLCTHSCMLIVLVRTHPKIVEAFLTRLAGQQSITTSLKIRQIQTISEVCTTFSKLLCNVTRGIN